MEKQQELLQNTGVRVVAETQGIFDLNPQDVFDALVLYLKLGNEVESVGYDEAILQYIQRQTDVEAFEATLRNFYSAQMMLYASIVQTFFDMAGESHSTAA